MKINGYNITAKNVWAYIQGNGRKTLGEVNPDIFQSPRHIQEQVVWREVIMNKTCYENGKCTHCKCSVPAKLYSDRDCEGGCYPAIMNKKEWNQFKQYCARKKMNMYNRKFDWETALADMSRMDPISFQSLISYDKASVHLGVGREGDILKHTFELFNPDQKKLHINNIQPSCSCTTIVPESYDIDSNEHGKLNVFINTKNLAIRDHEVWVTIRYNDIKRMNLKLTYTLKDKL